MRKLIILAVTASALMLVGCGANSAAQLDAIKAVVTDTNCQHDDKVSLVTGAAGVPASFQVSAERHCAPRAATPPTPGNAPGSPITG